MENRMGHPPGVAFKWYPFFAAHTFMSTKITCPHCELPAVRTRFTDGYKFLLCSLRLESSNCPEGIIVRYRGPRHSLVSRRARSAFQNS
jgi:hypothetical protein